MFSALHLVIILVITAGILLYLHVTRNFNHWKNKNVPYLKPIPFFGNFFKVFIQNVSVGAFLAQLYKTTKSPYLGFFVFDQPFLLIRDLELIKACLIKDFEYFDDRSVVENRRDDELGADVLFVLKNPAWKTIRPKLTPVFATGKMKNMLPLMVESAEDLAGYLSKISLKKTSSDAREISMKFTTDVISSCAFGINAHCFKYENAEFREAARRFFDLNLSRKIQMVSYFAAPFLVKWFRMKIIEPTAGIFLKNVFWETLSEREKVNNNRGDLIDVLIQIKKQNDANNNLFGKNLLVAQAVQFFAAGFETTGSTISFTLYEISLNTAIQDRLRSEIKSVLKKHGGITYEAIQEMNYLDMTISETLRKYPVLPFLDRRCKKPYKIPGTDVVIEKGIPVYVSLLGLHFDPEYFPNPEKYDPERFSYENKSTRPSFCYMPFGEGPHNCIGARFGLLSAKVALIRILSEFKAELCEDSPVPLKLITTGFLLAPEKILNLGFKRAE